MGVDDDVGVIFDDDADVDAGDDEHKNRTKTEQIECNFILT